MSFLFCPTCGPVVSINTHVVERKETVEVRGEPTETTNLVRICNVCDSSIFDRELDGASIKRAYETHREKHRLITPE